MHGLMGWISCSMCLWVQDGLFHVPVTGISGGCEFGQQCPVLLGQGFGSKAEVAVTPVAVNPAASVGVDASASGMIMTLSVPYGYIVRGRGVGHFEATLCPRNGYRKVRPRRKDSHDLRSSGPH